MADLPILVLPHPIGQLPNEEMRRIAEASLPEVEFVLGANAGEVARTYSGVTTSRSFPKGVWPVETSALAGQGEQRG
ncbi:MAG: hypothetical protein KGJ86_11540 [Chloroflexota bacterium]|nr:hypothetical protein [Chloroflexota bacterium]